MSVARGSLTHNKKTQVDDVVKYFLHQIIESSIDNSVSIDKLGVSFTFNFKY